jgi:peptide/nickel transport system ATP-binding protein
MTERPLLQIRDLAKRFDVSPPLLNRVLQGQPQAFVQAIDDVGFDIPRGTTFSLVGESGSGKSTVARVVVGLYRPTRGSVTFDGTDLASIKSRWQMAPLRRRWAMIFQAP